MTALNIGAASKAAGVSAKMIRHYESVGLLPAAARSASGYRRYTDNDVHTLRFVARARALGFTLDEIRELLDLWRDRRRSSRHVKALAQAHLQALEDRIRELEGMRAALARLVHDCHGDARPECPILDTLAADEDGASDPRKTRSRLQRVSR